MFNATLVRMRAVLYQLSISRSTFYQLIKSGKFPPPINIGARSVGWLSTDVEEFIVARTKASRPSQAQVAV